MTDTHEASDFAIEFEKRSIDFYARIKEWMRHSESGTLERVISEERRHIDYMIELRKNL